MSCLSIFQNILGNLTTPKPDEHKKNEDVGIEENLNWHQPEENLNQESTLHHERFMNCLEIIANIDLTRSPRNVNKVYADKMWEDLEKSSILYPRSDYFISELALIGDILSKDWHMHLLIIKNIEKRWGKEAEGFWDWLQTKDGLFARKLIFKEVNKALRR